MIQIYDFVVFDGHRRTHASVGDGIMKNYNKNNKIVSENVFYL
jgi:hypothetical protein